jgi:hypothetical protein
MQNNLLALSSGRLPTQRGTRPLPNGITLGRTMVLTWTLYTSASDFVVPAAVIESPTSHVVPILPRWITTTRSRRATPDTSGACYVATVTLCSVMPSITPTGSVPASPTWTNNAIPLYPPLWPRGRHHYRLPGRHEDRNPPGQVSGFYRGPPLSPQAAGHPEATTRPAQTPAYRDPGGGWPSYAYTQQVVIDSI